MGTGLSAAALACDSQSKHAVREMDARSAWNELEHRDDAVLVDVRTAAEWMFVGVPDLTPLKKKVVQTAWRLYPGFAQNPHFADELAAHGVAVDTPLYFLCRSGGRSLDAATAMAAHGYRECVNISDGFEGEPDEQRHRGTTGGWIAAGLPWRQE